jgi:hypothetical protein
MTAAADMATITITVRYTARNAPPWAGPLAVLLHALTVDGWDADPGEYHRQTLFRLRASSAERLEIAAVDGPARCAMATTDRVRQEVRR